MVGIEEAFSQERIALRVVGQSSWGSEFGDCCCAFSHNICFSQRQTEIPSITAAEMAEMLPPEAENAPPRKKAAGSQGGCQALRAAGQEEHLNGRKHLTVRTSRFGQADILIISRSPHSKRQPRHLADFKAYTSFSCYTSCTIMKKVLMSSLVV